MNRRLWTRDKPVAAALSLFLCLVVLMFLTACANPTVCLVSKGSAKSVEAAISPVLVKVAPDSEVQFAVQVAGKPAKSAKWLVNGVPGGCEAYGTIAGGLYHSPAVTPERNEVHVEARLAGGRKLFSTVIVGPYDPGYKMVKRLEMGDLTEGQLIDNHGICLDLSGNIIVTDATKGRVYRYTPDGEFINEIGLGKGTGPGYFNGPRDVKVDQRGRIYVIDTSEALPDQKIVVNRLQRLDPDGTIVVAKGKAEGGTDLNKPHSLDIAPSGRIYVADVNNKRVAVFDEDCNFLMGWPTPLIGSDKQCAPHGLGVDPNGDLFVADYNGVCLKYTGTGELLTVFGHQDGGRYHGMCTDRWGNVYIAARNKSDTHAYIKKYNDSGALVLTWIIDRDGHVGYPRCFFVGPDDKVYVTDEKGVDVFAPMAAQTAVEVQ